MRVELGVARLRIGRLLLGYLTRRSGMRDSSLMFRWAHWMRVKEAREGIAGRRSDLRS